MFCLCVCQCEVVGSLGVTGVTDSYELPSGCWDLKWGCLEEQPVVLTAEQSLQPYLKCLKCVYMCMWCVHTCGSHISSRCLLSCPPPYFLSFIYSFVYVNGCVHVTVYVWKSEDSMQVLEVPGFSDLKLCLCLENLFQAGD